MESEHAFFAVPLGDTSSVERKRADELTDYVVIPVLDEFDLELQRSDRDPTPGRITHQILKGLLEARVVIADVTGRNPNVYYELAVAHSFMRPVIMLVDRAKNIAFDTKDERVIEVGDYEGVLAVPQAEQVKKELRESLRIVLNDGFRPSSVVSDVGGVRSLEELAPENPMAAEINVMRHMLEKVLVLLEERRREQLRGSDATWALVQALEEAAEDGLLPPQFFALLATQEPASDSFKAWREALASTARHARRTHEVSDDDVPF